MRIPFLLYLRIEKQKYNEKDIYLLDSHHGIDGLRKDAQRGLYNR